MKNLFFLSLLFLMNSSFSKSPADSTSAADSLKNMKPVDTVVPDTANILSASDVIKKYVSAIGGEDKIFNIVDRTTVMRGSVQGMNITIVAYQKAPDKIKQEIKAGATEQLIIFNGEKGMMKMGGQNQEITGTELEKLKYEATLSLLTDPEHYGLKLTNEGKEKVGEKSAYKIVMTLPSGIKWTQYYDVESGLKVKEEKNISTPMGLFELQVFYDDYKDVEGMLIPFKINQSVGSQDMEFTVSSVKINTGLADREFELED